MKMINLQPNKEDELTKRCTITVKQFLGQRLQNTFTPQGSLRSTLTTGPQQVSHNNLHNFL